MNLFLSTTGAGTADTGGSMFAMILIYVIFFFFIWLLFIRPNKKEQKRMAAMLSTLENGDCVLTSSGFYGVIIDITDDTVIVEFGSNKNCRIPMQKSAIVRCEKPEQ